MRYVGRETINKIFFELRAQASKMVLEGQLFDLHTYQSDNVAIADCVSVKIEMFWF